jgi:hypothetical protein
MDRDRGAAFAIGCLAGASLSIAGLYLYQQQKQQRQVLHGSAEPLVVVRPATPAAVQPQQPQTRGVGPHPARLAEFDCDEILSEHLTRNVQFFGIEKQKIIANSFVVVVGLGVRATPWCQGVQAAVAMGRRPP